MKDPYEDDLGKLLNELDGPDLNEINNAIFKDGDLQGETNQAKRLELSEKIKSSYRHSLNLIASEHEPEWRKIVIATIDKLGIKLNKDEIDSLTILELEGKVIEKMIEKVLQENPGILNDVKSQMIEEISIKIKNEQILKQSVEIIKSLRGNELTGILSQVFNLAAPYVVEAAMGSIPKMLFDLIGYGPSQKIILTILFRTFGFWAGIKGILGIGLPGMLMTAAKLAGPIGLAIDGIIVIYKLGDTAWRKVIPTVMAIGFWRLKVEYERKQKESQEQEKNLLNS